MKDMTGKKCVVTGANTGIGEATALELARAGAEVILACRSLERGEEAAERIRAETRSDRVSVHALDLGDLAQVRQSAEALEGPIDVLINNAGVAASHGVTVDGFERTFGVNHLGHYLFTRLLLDRLAPDARIVNVASRAHYRTSTIDFDRLREPTKTTTGLPEYAVSKLANVLFTKALTRRVPEGVKVHALHPGVVASDVWRRVPWPFRSILKLFLISNADGAKTTLHCATSDECGRSTGLYYDESRVKEPNAVVHDEALQEELWARSASWVGLPA